LPRQSVVTQSHSSHSTSPHSNYPDGNSNPSDFQIARDVQYLTPYQDPSPSSLSPLSQFKRADLFSLPDSSMPPSAVYSPEPRSATSSENSPPGSAEAWTPSSKGPSVEPQRRGRPRREKPHIELAPDQPPTTQGKARSRVYVACVQWCVPSHNHDTVSDC
jgi:hypothetical protein